MKKCSKSISCRKAGRVKGAPAPICLPVVIACEVCDDPDVFLYQGELICPTCIEFSLAIEDGEDDR